MGRQTTFMGRQHIDSRLKSIARHRLFPEFSFWTFGGTGSVCRRWWLTNHEPAPDGFLFFWRRGHLTTHPLLRSSHSCSYGSKKARFPKQLQADAEKKIGHYIVSENNTAAPFSTAKRAISRCTKRVRVQQMHHS